MPNPTKKAIGFQIRISIAFLFLPHFKSILALNHHLSGCNFAKSSFLGYFE
jgi:hypothetical protein